jgi:uncharacterized damage-inducible protein DinB
MAVKDGMLMELKHEAANTRKMLERVPFEKAAWKPHEKSHSLSSLATHIARLPTWVERVITRDEFDPSVPGAFPKIDPPTTTQELLAFFDKNIADATKSFEGASDEILMKPWTFHRGEQVFFTLPKVAAIRNMGFSHTYHHRGQLSVYLRLLDVPIPGMYGPSADEQ